MPGMMYEGVLRGGYIEFFFNAITLYNSREFHLHFDLL